MGWQLIIREQHWGKVKEKQQTASWCLLTHMLVVYSLFSHILYGSRYSALYLPITMTWLFLITPRRLHSSFVAGLEFGCHNAWTTGTFVFHPFNSFIPVLLSLGISPVCLSLQCQVVWALSLCLCYFLHTAKPMLMLLRNLCQLPWQHLLPGPSKLVTLVSK